MSPLAASSATQTSLVPSASSTWHVGISPVFPPSLILTNDAAIESLLTDIPFLSVGLLGFGVLTFFFVMQKFNRVSFYVFASVIVAFIAGVLDVGQILSRGRAATDADTNVSSVLPLLVARELALSVSIGFRFLFFWVYVSLPPRGEPRLLSTKNYQPSRLKFLQLESNGGLHSGNWIKLGYVGGFLKYSLLLTVIFVTLFQIFWRVVADFSKIGPVYDADSALEVALSALFIIKLFINAWLSPLTPRWKTIRDYSPVIVALFIGLGIGIGNIMQFQFSETSLGRFFQAVELYILVLYVHVNSFYERRTRINMHGSAMQVPATKPSSTAGGTEARSRMSTTFQMISATTFPSRALAGEIPLPSEPFYSLPNNNLSSWLIPETEQTPLFPGTPRRISLVDRLSSLITGRRNSALQDVDNGIPSFDTKTSFGVAKPSSQPLKRIAIAPSGIKNGLSRNSTIASFFAAENSSRDDRTPPKLPKLPGSPVYRLDGLIRYYGQPSSLSPPSSVHSSSMEYLSRQQAEMDQCVAELQLLSHGVTSGHRQTVLGGQSISFGSDFSLSIFPTPPNPPGPLPYQNIPDVPRGNGSDDRRTPQPLPADTESRKSQSDQLGHNSFASSVSSSTDAAVLGVASRTVLGSGGYDVTSFIGNLTSPSSKDVFQADSSRQNSFIVERPGAENLPAAKTRLSADATVSVGLRAQAPPLAPMLGMDANPPEKPSPPRRMKQGLPSGIKQNISGSIRRPSIESPTTYERPRAVPQTT